MSSAVRNSWRQLSSALFKRSIEAERAFELVAGPALRAMAASVLALFSLACAVAYATGGWPTVTVCGFGGYFALAYCGCVKFFCPFAAAVCPIGPVSAIDP